MKNVYSNLYAMRAIVCVAHEWVSDEHPYNFSFSIFNFQLVVNVKWKIMVGKTVCKMQNTVTRPFFVYMRLYVKL